MAKHILNIDTDILGVLNLPNLNNDTGRLLTINNSNIVSERTISEIAVEGNFELKSNKGIANGYVPLDNSGLIPQAYLPPVTISETFVVASQTTMLALVAQTGDVAVRTDENKSYILQGTNPTILSEWQELLSPTDLVQSVNGLTGTVTLDLIFNSGLLSMTSGNSVNLDDRYYTETEVNSLLTDYSPTGHTHVIADITDFPTDISHFNNDSGYLTSFTETDPIFTAHTASNIVNGTGLLKNDGVGNWSYDNSTYLTTISGLSHTLLSNVGVNTHAQIDSHIANSSTHFTMGSISITESQISDLQSYLTTEVNDLTQSVVWDNVPDTNITQSSVVQHQAALTITESQISDLNHFTPSTLLADYSFTDNSVNWDTAYSWGNHAGLYSLLGHTHTFNSLTSKPTTIAGYGITDIYTKTESDGRYLLNTTDTLNGNLTVTNSVESDIVAANSYFRTPSLVGQDDNSTYYHRVDFGYAGNNKVDFYEYGGEYNFYKNTVGTLAGAVLIADITQTGISANSFIKMGGTSSQFLKADGSVDNNTYLLTSGKATDSNLLDGLNSSSFLRSDTADTLDATLTISNNGTIVYDDADRGTYIPRPKGGSYKTSTQSVTGAIAINLPSTISSDMLSFWVDVYDYSENESISVFISGYAYGSSSWNNETSFILTKNHNKNYTIRYAHNGSNWVVYIGELNTVWSYPQINVRDFQAGFSSVHTTLVDGWSIEFESVAFLNVRHTNTDNLLASSLLNGQPGSYYQPASTALKTTTTFGGDVSGTYNNIVVADDSHNHIISNIDGLQTELNSKTEIGGTTFSGTYPMMVQVSGNNLYSHPNITYNGSSGILTVPNITEGGTALSSKYLGISAKAADSNLLDGLDSSAFLRSNTSDSFTSGTLTFGTGTIALFQDNVNLRLGTGSDTRMYHNGSHTYIDHYTGNIYVRNNTTTRVTIERTTGNITAGDFILSSDIRKKTEIKPIQNKPLDLNFVEYKYKDGDTERLRYGVIADDVEKVAPELVTHDEEGFKQVSYIDLLIRKVSELENEKIKSNDKISKLEKDNKDLNDKLNKIIKHLNL